jgi:hypothetical protein
MISRRGFGWFAFGWLALVFALLLGGCAGDPPAEPMTQRATPGAAPAVRGAPGTQPQPATGTGPCYEAGFRYGVCAAKNTADGSCDPASQAPIPPECQPRPETQQGIKDGLRSIQMKHRTPGS